jgi:hypothetical protein
MSPADKLHSFLPVFNWGWWVIFLFTLLIDWGVVLLIKRFEPLGWKRAYWWSGLYGDIFLPLGIASSAVVLRSFKPYDMWFTSRWWNWLVLMLGILIIFLVEIVFLFKKTQVYTKKQELMPSKLWHTILFPVMFYLSVITIIPLFSAHTPLWAFILALAGYGGWIFTVFHDIVHPPDFHKTH